MGSIGQKALTFMKLFPGKESQRLKALPRS